MFWSKIWFFLVAVVAATGIVVTLVMPRTAEREAQSHEREVLSRACNVTEILLRDEARTRIEFAGQFARARGADMRIDQIAGRASRQGSLEADTISEGRQALADLLGEIRGAQPDFALLVDTRGRVVAQRGAESFEAGDALEGRPLVDEVLSGYVRDDLWVTSDLYRVAGAPIVLDGAFVGAVILGHSLGRDFADRIAETLDVEVAFYANGSVYAASNPAQIHNQVLEPFEGLNGRAEDAGEPGDCGAYEPAVVTAGGTSYTTLSARLPGEAGAVGGVYTVFVERTESVGLAGMLSRVQRSDLSMGEFPWIRVAAGLIVLVLAGLVLLAIEGDRPLRRLNDEAVALAKGERERFEEDRHGGKFGSIARSVNISVDKLKRDAKAAQRDLDELLGPAPDAGAGSAPGAASPGAPSPAAPGLAPEAPPPSSFSFSDQKSPSPAAPDPLGLSDPAPAKPAKPAPPAGAATKPPPSPPAAPPAGKAGSAPPPVPPKAAQGKSRAKSAPAAPDKPPPSVPSSGASPAAGIDDDILGVTGGDEEDSDSHVTRAQEPAKSTFDEAATQVAEPGQGGSASDAEEAYFRQIFDEFLALKKSCGEETKNLTYEAFARKLRSNRDTLMAKHNCSSVRFQVYEKDGRAALKASPSRD